MQDNGNSSPRSADEDYAPENIEKLPDSATGQEISQYDREKTEYLTNQTVLAKQLRQLRLAGAWFVFIATGLHLLANFILIILHITRCIAPLTEEVFYYMGASTVSSFALVGFFVRGVFSENPRKPHVSPI